MHDFGKLVYLDVPKTGSTFISNFLNATCKLPLVKELKHQRIGNDFRQDSFYFISVRNPLSLYMSLYRYGLDGKGMLRRRLDAYGWSHLYQAETGAGFNAWLRFMLDYKNEAFLGEGFEEFGETFGIGFLTYRFLMLSFAHPAPTLRSASTYDELIQLYETSNIARLAIRQEMLSQGLLAFATRMKPEFFYQDRVVQFLSDGQKLNASKNRKGSLNELDADVRGLVLDREKFLFSKFYREESL